MRGGFTIRGTVLLLQFPQWRQLQRTTTERIAAYGGYEGSGARFCESKLYLTTNVRNFILDEAMARKGSGICDSKDEGKLANQSRGVRIASGSGVQTAFFSE